MKSYFFRLVSSIDPFFLYDVFTVMVKLPGKIFVCFHQLWLSMEQMLSGSVSKFHPKVRLTFCFEVRLV